MFKCHLYLVKVILSEGYSSMHVATHAVMRSAPRSSYRRPVSPYTFQSVLLLAPVPWRPLICCPLIQFCLFQTVTQMEPYGTQLFESAFFCSALCFWFRSMLLHVSEVCSFLLLHTIPSSGYDFFFFFAVTLFFIFVSFITSRALWDQRWRLVHFYELQSWHSTWTQLCEFPTSEWRGKRSWWMTRGPIGSKVNKTVQISGVFPC